MRTTGRIVVGVIGMLVGCTPAVHTLEQIRARALPELGHVTITRPDGTETVAPLQLCQNGERVMIEGVDLAGVAPLVTVRVGIDTFAGPRIQLDTLASDAPWMLDASTCSTWNVSIGRTTTRINGVRMLDVELAVACALPDQTVVALVAGVRGCAIDSDTTVVRDALAESHVELARIAALPTVPEVDDAPPPRVLTGHTVALRARVVGEIATGETREQVQATCDAGIRDFATRLGAVVAAQSESHDLELEMSCSAYVGYEILGDEIVLQMPSDGLPGVVVRRSDATIGTIPPAALEVRCPAGGTRAEREERCHTQRARWRERELVTGIGEIVARVSP